MKKLIKNSPLKYSGPTSTGATGITSVLTSQGTTGTTTVNTSRPSTDTCPTFLDLCNDVFVLEKHLTVIRKGPTSPPALEMQKFTDETALVSGDTEGKVTANFSGGKMWASWNFCNHPHDISCTSSYPKDNRGRGFDAEDISEFYRPDKTHKQHGDKIVIPIDISQTNEDWDINDKLIIEHEYTDSWGDIKKASAMVSIDAVDYLGNPNAVPANTLGEFTQIQQFVNQNPPNPNDADGAWGFYTGAAGSGWERYIQATIITTTSNFPLYVDTDEGGMPTYEDIYHVKLVQNPALFKHKFPRFAYRYKYEDGEYSVFSPWSEIAFIPESFDYLPKKGYNLGMENALRSLRIKNFIPKDMPEDVIQVDILYKESNAPGVYTVASVKRDDPIEAGQTTKPWETPGTGDNFGNYKIKSELIHKVVPSNQLLRPWDNVPKKAQAQEITANRIIYANYLQNYNVKDTNNHNIVPKFSTNIEQRDHSINSVSITGPKPGEPAKSLKSMRTYQLGIVYRDRYGRETPVLTDKTGSFKLDKSYAITQNRLQVKMESNPPYWAESYTFYVKETSNEYYNLAMDRWYDAEDGGIWLSFPSSERNKISGGLGDESTTTLILKKQHDSHVFSGDNTKYKVLSVKNDAPTYIKTDLKYWGALPMCLPPPGWGDVGNWDSGMFYPSGLPLPHRMYMDVIAEYWDQSVMKSLNGKDGAQVRIIQSAGQAAAYNAGLRDSTNKTRWYDVANIEYIGAPPQTFEETTTDDDGVTITNTVEEPGGVAQLVRISLEKAFGEDAAFCKPEYNDYFNQPSNSVLDRGLSLEARTKEVKDRAQFEGRFFVKVLRDYNIDQDIVLPQQGFSEKWQVLQSKDIRYIASGHPGLQDWCPNTTNSTCTDAYIPIGQGITAGIASYTNQLVSSYGKFHAGKGADYTDDNGAAQEGPVHGGPGPYWPIGPSDATDGTFHQGYWYAKYGPDGEGRLDSSKNFPDEGPDGLSGEDRLDWPSYAIGNYNPYMCFYDCDNAVDKNGNTTTLAGVKFAMNMITAAATSSTPYRTTSGYGRVYDINSKGVLNLHEAIPFTESQTNYGGNQIYDPGTSWSDNSYLDGANPYAIPAIWGDQSDLLTNPPVWKTSTIEKLREDWYGLWKGRDFGGKNWGWPLGRFHPNRWIFDKAGAAGGYSGNGIWNDGNVSYIDFAFWGIGSESSYNRKNSHGELMQLHHPTEIAFANAISTIGTQFRFQQDPDQTVYTITNVEVDDGIWNYEEPQGSWALEDSDNPGNPLSETGGGIGTERLAPWGSIGDDGPLPGGLAFISDLFSKSRTKTGGAPYNRRMRFTVTLDKIIGLEGGAGFHPILNHVDKDGKANIKSGRGKYFTGFPGGQVTTAKGGTPGTYNSGVEFYNLASYWSQAVAPTLDQPDTIADQATGQYIGLHERGLNETTIEIITPYRGDDKSSDRMSNNPAVWETEPTEDVGLDIYYAASPTYPVKITRFRREEDAKFEEDYPDFYLANWYDYGLRGEEIIPVGSSFTPIGVSPISPSTTTICAVQNNTIWLMPLSTSPAESAFEDGAGNDVDLPLGTEIKISAFGEGTFYGAGYDMEEITLNITKQLNKHTYQVEVNTHAANRQLGYFNCYSFGNGVESNRIRDDYNAVQIDKGVKASMPLAEQYEEERRCSSLIFSGIYNSTSGINRTNQFIQAEPITKDINPINGTIQKLFARDTDLLTFCENKVFKILAKKDALFNADGNTNVTSNAAVLGQTIPFTGEYGISKNPESFASEAYRVYFADKARGAILQVSGGGGLVPISDAGMRDWFKDNLRFASSIIGSYDDREDQYNLTIETEDQDGNDKAYTLSWVESKKGWVSFKSFLQQGGISHKNIYYTFPSNKYNFRNYQDPWGVNYYSPGQGRAETWQHHLDLIIKRDVVTTSTSNSTTMIVSAGKGTLIPGMNVEGNGIHVDTLIDWVSCGGPTCIVDLSHPAWVENGDEIKFTTARNSFYGNDEHYSMLKVVFNQAQGTVKRFKTLDYEGTQAKTIERTNNRHIIEGVDVGQIYYDNYAKKGWYVENMFTDMQKGNIPEFIDKENKWYNYIRGFEDAGRHDHLDTAEFSLQGLGYADTGVTPPPPPPPPPPGGPTYNCINGSCIDPGDGSGQYADIVKCQRNCGGPPVSWECYGNGQCYDPGTGTGTYATEADCLQGCVSVPETWNCVDAGTSNANCVDPGDGTGTFTSRADCWNNCSAYPISWDCILHRANTAPHFYSVDTYSCEDPGNGMGAYTTQAACQTACQAPQESWDCVGVIGTNFACQDPGDGTGAYTSLSDCQNDGCGTWYCDDGSVPHGNPPMGCNNQGFGIAVPYCDSSTCIPQPVDINYYLWCKYDGSNPDPITGMGTYSYHFNDVSQMQMLCGMLGNTSIPPVVNITNNTFPPINSKFHNAWGHACYTFVGILPNQSITPYAGQSIQVGNLTFDYDSTLNECGCKYHPANTSGSMYYPPNDPNTSFECSIGCDNVTMPDSFARQAMTTPPPPPKPEAPRPPKQSAKPGREITQVIRPLDTEVTYRDMEERTKELYGNVRINNEDYK